MGAEVRVIPYEKDSYCHCWLERWQKGPTAKKSRWPRDPGGGKRTGSPLWPPEWKVALPHLDPSPVRPTPDFSPMEQEDNKSASFPVSRSFAVTGYGRNRKYRH